MIDAQFIEHILDLYRSLKNLNTIKPLVLYINTEKTYLFEDKDGDLVKFLGMTIRTDYDLDETEFYICYGTNN